MRKLMLMALATVTMAATAANNPFLEYKNWKTPHGTYPFNEIHAEHYMPAFDEAFKQGLQEIDAIVNNPAAPTFANTIEAYEASGTAEQLSPARMGCRPVAVHLDYTPSPPFLSILPCLLLHICSCGRSCLLIFQVILIKSFSVYSCNFGVPKGGSKLRVFLCCYLGYSLSKYLR